MSSEFLVVPLEKGHQRSEFDCGIESLNLFLKNYARQNDEKGLSRTFVAIRPGENTVHGYYSLSAASVSFEQVPEKLPRYPIPTAHIGRLAVDRSRQGFGLGEFLLIDALRRTVLLADTLGIFAVELYAINESAKSFYLRYGFTELADDPYHVYLSIRKIRQLGLI
jgi:GNAT superfamily N-acetyltransferase